MIVDYNVVLVVVALTLWTVGWAAAVTPEGFVRSMLLSNILEGTILLSGLLVYVGF